MAKVLVVDDNRDLCEVLVRMLRFCGHDPSCVLDGAAALDAARREVPGLVFLDVTMPGLDGFDVLRALRADHRTAAVPVVMYTAMSDPARRDRAMAMGASDYVVKNLSNLESLRELVDRYACPPA